MVSPVSDHDEVDNLLAIELTNVTVCLGNRTVLRSVDLSVRQGGIFALLGPSGCGKTTLIRTLVGRLHPVQNEDGSRGKVSILGEYPYAFGQFVGFMPQEMALHSTNTIKEELYFYGRLANMSSKRIEQRYKFLVEFLELPKKRKFISGLSGGQQRRVSFAIALLHNPKLLILDEPTVGVDPLLRKKIWQHLKEITMTRDATAILTTHYIEEARQADMVSFMRHGQLLETDSPDKLLVKHGQQSLEAVFLELCEGQHSLDAQSHQHSPVHRYNPLTIGKKMCNSYRSTSNSCCSNFLCSRLSPSTRRSLYALLIKDTVKFQRNPFMLIVQLLVPILQITLFCLCVGQKLTDIPFGFVSREVAQLSSTGGLLHSKIDRKILRLVEYTSIGEAERYYNLGYLSGIIDIGANFTKELLDKTTSCAFSDVNRYNDSQLTIYLDPTNQQMIYTVAQEFQRVLKIIDIDYHIGIFTAPANRSLFQLGKFSNDSLHIEYTFTHFMVPGIILSVIFFLNVALTALSLVVEQADGTQDRVWITGVNSSQIVFSQLIIHSIILIIQIVIVLFTALYVFEIPSRGSLLYTSLLCLVQGFCGMTFGLVVSVIFTTEINAHQVTMACFYPVLLLSGIVWPLEGQPKLLRTVSRWLPMTKAIDAIRGILLKGWSIDHLVVQQGLVITVAWSFLFLTITLIIFNCRRV